MQYVIHRSHRMQIHKLGLTCPSALFMETTLGPPEQEKWCIDISLPGRTEMHYMTCRSHRMQKHKFGIKCLDPLFVKSIPVPPEHEK
jgi:hypothetical protein